jgi:hypothetical protein
VSETAVVHGPQRVAELSVGIVAGVSGHRLCTRVVARVFDCRQQLHRIAAREYADMRWCLSTMTAGPVLRSTYSYRLASDSGLTLLKATL